MAEKTIACLNDCGDMEITPLDKNTRFRGVDIDFQVEHYLCPECGLEAGTTDQSAETQRVLADTYREKIGLLTGREIRELREEKNLSQENLAERMGVGIAIIQKWENCQIQTNAMDQALRLAFQDQFPENSISGNREFSLPRIRLVLRFFENELGRTLLKKNDRTFGAARYLWYADMMAHRELGMSMTGANYSALPRGPQLNNFRELIEPIMDADESRAEPLSREETRILRRIALSFHSTRALNKAVQQEPIWQNTPLGAPIPYADSGGLEGI